MPYRILLVEDDLAIVEFVTLGLGYEGYEVTAAGTAREALAQFATLGRTSSSST